MNPLTIVKRIQNLNKKEASLSITEEASWHAKYKDSAYVFVGGIPFDLTEGDLLAVFAQYGEIVDVNLVRDKGTGKSKGFAFVAYEDQRSTILAVDNLNGAQVLGRIIRVDHVENYKKKEEEDDETMQRKREERGVCRAFQKGECTRGAGCKFSHDERRAADTGWGHEDARNTRWGHDKFEGPTKPEKQLGGGGGGREKDDIARELHSEKRNFRVPERQMRNEREIETKKYRKNDPETHSRDRDHRSREEKKLRNDESEYQEGNRSKHNRDQDDTRSYRDGYSSSHRHVRKDEDERRGSHR